MQALTRTTWDDWPTARSDRTIPAEPSVRICLMGTFRLLSRGRPVVVRGGGKAELLLTSLALRYPREVRRDALLDALWPKTDAGLAGQSLRTLLCGLHKLLGPALNDQPPILHQGGNYWLNVAAGIDVDAAAFDRLARAGDEELRRGDRPAAAARYGQAAELYLGDLCSGADIGALIERERVRARHLNMLAWLSQYHFEVGSLAESLHYALTMLANEPCREDAHRLAMRCYARRGQRAQALRQYRLCVTILRHELDAAPEPRTADLFTQIRLAPDTV